jgi:hypothetical protein
LTLVLQVAKPFRIADMNDDWQEARILREEKDSATVEVVHHPLRAGAPLVPNPGWRKDYSSMADYLRPTPTENWDEGMRAALVADLRHDGIDPDRLTDVDLVRQVSAWALRRSRFGKPFTSFFVQFPGGRPEVPSGLREAFDKEKPSPETPDQAMFDHEVLGRSMYYDHVHGACTSYAVYQATLLRALGIPTRIIVCVPPLDANDPAQRTLLLGALHQNAVRASVRHSLPAESKHGIFSDHMFNEVFVGKRWVRLNYARLEQPPLDEDYLGLQVHILTEASLSQMALAGTWGERYAHPGAAQPALSSQNPYRLLSVSERLAGPNPDVPDELGAVHVVAAHWKNRLPQDMESQAPFHEDPRSHFYLRIQEFIPHYRHQTRDFMGKASRHFLLKAEGLPSLRATHTGFTASFPGKDQQVQVFGFGLEEADLPLLVPGAAYRLVPVENTPEHPWVVDPTLVLPGVQPTVETGIHELSLRTAYWREAIPVESIRAELDGHEHRSELFLRVDAGEGARGSQVDGFIKNSGTTLLLTAPGQPAVTARYTRSIYSSRRGGDETWTLVGFALEGKGRGSLVPGVTYSLRPVASVEGYTWPDPPALTLVAVSAPAQSIKNGEK